MNKINKKNYHELQWLGSESMCLDEVAITHCSEMILGCYGGNTLSGACKNEDGAFILCDDKAKWKLAIVLDAHCSIQSAELIIHTIKGNLSNLIAILDEMRVNIYDNLHSFFKDLFMDNTFREKCQNIQGETACLICVQRDEFLWWFSVGDNLLLLLNTELAELGQFTLNQRNFYEWIGYKNTFDLDVPCYSSGVRELRSGNNYIYLITDGVLECGNRPFENHRYLYEQLTNNKDNIAHNIRQVLEEVANEKGRDSATIVGWRVLNEKEATMPSG